MTTRDPQLEPFEGCRVNIAGYLMSTHLFKDIARVAVRLANEAGTTVYKYFVDVVDADANAISKLQSLFDAQFGENVMSLDSV